jgi:hypothetical protein
MKIGRRLRATDVARAVGCKHSNVCEVMAGLLLATPRDWGRAVEGATFPARFHHEANGFLQMFGVIGCPAHRFAFACSTAPAEKGSQCHQRYDYPNGKHDLIDELSLNDVAP